MKNNWISCQTQPPEPYKLLHLYVKYPDGYEQYSSCHYNGRAYYSDGGAPIAGTPLFWQEMILPDPPYIEGDDNN